MPSPRKVPFTVLQMSGIDLRLNIQTTSKTRSWASKTTLPMAPEYEAMSRVAWWCRTFDYGSGPRDQVHDSRTARDDLEVLGLGRLCEDAGRRPGCACVNLNIFGVSPEAGMRSSERQRSRRFRTEGFLQPACFCRR